MKYNYEYYPEVLMVDCTYKLNDLKMQMHIMLIVDGNGQTEIVAICLTSSETNDVISTMVQSFKESNPSWTKTSIVITEKDFVERSVFDEEFPSVIMHIYLSHALKSMRREISCEKLGVRQLCTYVFLLTYIGTYYVQMILLIISDIIVGPRATLNSWTVHCSVCCHIWSPLLPIIAEQSIAFNAAHIWSPCYL